MSQAGDVTKGCRSRAPSPWQHRLSQQQKVSVLLEKASCSRVDFHAPRGRTGKPVASQEGKIAKQEWGGGETWIKHHPPHLQEGNWEKAWCGNELPKIKGI